MFQSFNGIIVKLNLGAITLQLQTLDKHRIQCHIINAHMSSMVTEGCTGQLVVPHRRPHDSSWPQIFIAGAIILATDNWRTQNTTYNLYKHKFHGKWGHALVAGSWINTSINTFLGMKKIGQVAFFASN